MKNIYHILYKNFVDPQNNFFRFYLKKIFLIISLALCSHSWAQLSDDWSYSMPIRIDPAFVDEPLSEWTLVFDQSFSVILTQADGPLDADGTRPSLNGGLDIRFSTDDLGNEEIPVDIRSWVINNDPSLAICEVAVRIPLVNDASITTIYMWWGNINADLHLPNDPNGSYNAYDNDHFMVSNGDGTTDRTSNGMVLTPQNGLLTGSVSGKIGPATDYPGAATQQYVQISDVALFDNNITHNKPWTIEALTKRENAASPSFEFILSKIKASSDYRGWSLSYDPINSVLGFTISGDNNPLERLYIESAINLTINSWYHIAATYDGSLDISGMSLFEGGSILAIDDSNQAGTITGIDHSNPALIGARNWGAPATQREWDGVIDEIRIHTSTRSEAWLKANYHNFFNTPGFIIFCVPDDSFDLADPFICEGETATITTDGSEVGVNYQLRLDSDNTPVGATVAGDGNPIVFNVNPTLSTIYNVLAKNDATDCEIELIKKSTVTVNKLPTTSLSLITDPTTCGGNGSIELVFTNVPDNTYTIDYDGGTFANVVVSGGSATISTTAGTYENLSITVTGCTSTEDVDVTLTDPPTPTISLTSFSNPTTCGGNGSIELAFTNVPDNTYTIDYDGGAFANVAVSGSSATISATAGTYENLSITVISCSSTEDVDVTLSDPVLPVIESAVGTNPPNCGENGLIGFTFSNVPDGIYTINYDGGSFTNVNVFFEIALVTTPSGSYNNLSITVAGCSSQEDVDVVLLDPPAPTISLTSFNNPLTCGGNGSIILGFTNVPDNIYTIDYDGGTFLNVSVVGNTAAISTPSGIFNNLSITVAACSSSEDVDVSLSDPPTPTISLISYTDPITCGGNGSIELTFTDVPDNIYTIDYDGGTFANVAVNGGSANINTTAGTYENLSITVAACTSTEDVDVTLTDPPKPSISLTSFSNPTTCGGNGSIELAFTNVPDNTYTIDYDGGTFANVVVSAGTATISTTAGTYENLSITVTACTSTEEVDVTLSDPDLPEILSAVGSDPANCGENGLIGFTFSNVPDGIYSINYDGGSFANVNVLFGIALVSTPVGNYNNLSITVAECTSTEDVDVILSDPPTPTIAAVGTDPAVCGGDGSIAFTFTNVPDGTYNIDYDGGSFANVSVIAGAATVNAPQGDYNNLSITITECTSAEDPSISLIDPPTPSISLTSFSNPTTCGGNGSIELAFTNVPDNTYTIDYDGGAFVNIAVSGGSATISATAGTYENLSITVTACTSTEDVDVTLSDPDLPEIVSAVGSDPANCGENGLIGFTFSNVPDGIYSINYDGGSFANVNVFFGIALVSTPVGNYNNLSITVAECTSTEDVDVILSDPPTPTIAAVGTNPAVCGGDGSIAFTFTNVPDGTYNIDYDGGSFANVSVTAGAATVNAPQGDYNNLSITIAGCTSVEDPSISLIDPPTPSISLTSFSNPTTCGGNGSIELAFTNVPDNTYTIDYDGGTFANVVVSAGTATISTTAGTYENLSITVTACTSTEEVDVTLSDPDLPEILSAVGSDPANCGENGLIGFTFSNVPDGIYSINYDGGSFANVNVLFGIALVSTPVGNYNNLSITVAECTSTEDIDVILSDPPTPTIAAVGTDPAVCGGDGSIAFTFTNVPDGTYNIDYDGGSFANVSVTAGAATVNAPQGDYNNLSITITECTSAEDPSISLTDPPTPTIAAVGTDPAVCGGDGSIAFTFTNVPDNTYTIDYDGGTFANVVVSAGTATISTTAGTYENLSITVTACTSTEEVDVTLSDPDLPEILSAVGSDPANCGENGLIGFTFSNVPDGIYSINYDGGSFANVNVLFGIALVSTPVGNYNNLSITVAECTSTEDIDVILSDPPTPTIAAVGTDPAVCGGDGSIAFTFTNVPDGTYNIDYDGGSFANVSVTAGAATVNAPQGDYNNLSITITECTSAEDPSISLTDPPTPTIAAVGTNPAVCGGDGSIAFAFTNVPDGTYNIDYDGGSFANVSVTAGAATVNAPQGDYNNLSITITECTSAEDPSISLTDPPTPTIAALGTDPTVCGGDGSIAFTFTNVPNGTYNIDYDGSSFEDVVISGGSATISATAGTYENLSITVGACTSTENIDVTLSDPPGPSISLVSFSNPTTCGGNGSIELAFTNVPDNTYTIDYDGGEFANIAVSGGSATINATAGSYENLSITVGACTSTENIDVTLSDPPGPSISLISFSNPTTCGGNGSIELAFTNVPDNTYTIDYDGGAFANIAVSGGSATISATAGSYENLSITVGACTSTENIDVTLSDPPGPSISLVSFSNPTTCGGNGSIELAFTNVPDNTYTIDYDGGAFANIAVSGGSATISATAGTYENLSITVTACTSTEEVDVTLSDPDLPEIVSAVGSDPANCGENGLIGFTFSNVPDGIYSINYDGGSFANVNVFFGIALVSTPVGNYNNLSITVAECTSTDDVDVILSDPPTPTIAAVGTNPAVCGGDGSIAFAFTNVPDGTYNIDYNGGSFANVSVIAGAATVNAPQGDYNNLSITIAGCTSAEDPSISLTDPPTPTIAAVGTNPAVCGGDGSIAFTFTNVPDGTYNIDYNGGSFEDVVVSGGSATINATAGSYENLSITVGACTSTENINVTLSDPPGPSISLISFSNPTTCGGNGSIELAFTNVPDNTYTIDYDGGAFANIAVSGGSATISANAGTYENLSITVGACTSTENIDVTLSDPPGPSISLISFSNPTTCGGNGSIELAFTNVPDNTYTIDYDGGEFANIAVSGGSATINATAGSYENLSITVGACTSTENIDVTLSDPPGPSISLISFSNPTTCGGNGSIELAFTNVPDNTYTIDYDGGAFANIAVSGGSATINATAGTYENLSITVGACTSTENIDVTLSDPPGPSISLISFSNPTTCGGNGSIELAFTNVPDNTYTIDYDGGAFANIAVSGGSATISATAGSYENLSITVGACTSTENIDVTLSDPPGPSISLISFSNPTTCGGNGSIELAFTNVPDNTYTIDYDGGAFANIAVSGGSATINATTGTYENLSITVAGCTSTEDVDVTLTDPEDTENPVFEAPPADVTVNCIDAVPEMIDLGWTDNCDGSGSVTGIDEPLVGTECNGTITRTWTYTDNSGNIGSASQIITLLDTISPIPICQPINLDLNPDGLATIEPSDIDDGSFDNCSEVSLTASQLSFDCSDVGPKEVTLTVTDACGNVSTCIAVVTVNDVTAPVIVCPEDQELNIGAGCQVALPDYSDLLIINESCGIESIEQTPAAGTLYTEAEVGIYTISFVVTDVNGLEAGCSFNLEVLDLESFTIDNVDFTDALCFGSDDGTITVTTTGGPSGLFYSIDGIDYSNTSGIFNGLAPGIYSVSVKNTNDCILNWPDDIEITEPEELIIESVAITDVSGCHGDLTGSICISVTGGTPEYEYSIDGNEWSNENCFENLGAGSYTVVVRDANGCITSLDVEISEPPLLTLLDVSIQDVETCNGDASGGMIVTATGGTGILTYTITSGSTSYTNNDGVFTNLPAGFYQVGVEDENGCESSFDILFEIDEPPSISITNVSVTDVSTCSYNTNGSIEITADGGTGDLMYSIFGEEGPYQSNPTFTDLGVGAYIIWVMDANGCMVEYNNNPVIVGGPDAIVISDVFVTDVSGCNGNSNGSIIIVADGGTGALTYSIFGEEGPYQSNPEFTDLGAGAYAIWVEDANGCRVTYENNPVVIGEPPVLDITEVDVSDIVCYGSTDGTILITAEGGTGALEYSISGNNPDTYQSNPEFTDLGAGAYEIWVRDANGCTTEFADNPVVIDEWDEIIVSEVIAESIGCNGELGRIEILASGGSGTLEYSINNGENYQLSNLFTNLQSDTYIVRVRYVGIGCFVYSPDNPVVISDYTPMQASITKQDVLTCNGDANGSILVNATGGFGSKTYILNGFAQSDPLFTDLPAGTYELVIEDERVCTYVYPELIEITEPDALLINEVTQYLDGPGCFGHTEGVLEVEAEGGEGILTYLLNEGDYESSDGLFTGLPGGLYELSVIDENGCEIAYTDNPIEIFENSEIVYNSVFWVDVSECYGNENGSISIEAGGGTGQLEYSIDGGETWLSDAEITGLSVGSYQIVIRDALGCERYYEGNPVVLTGPDPLEIESVEVFNASCYQSNDGRLVISSPDAVLYSIDGGVSWQSSSLFIDLAVGDYEVAIQDENACIFYYEETVSIQEPEEILIEDVLVTDVSCNGRLGVIDIRLASNPSQMRYSIDGGITLSDVGLFENLSAGEYNIIVSSGLDCEVAYEGNPVTLVNDNEFDIDFIVNGGNAACVLSEVVLEAQVDGAIQFNWSTGNDGSEITVQSNTTGPQSYWCEVLREDGCINTDTVIVDYKALPDVGIEQENEQATYCVQQEVSLVATSSNDGVSYYWPASGISGAENTVSSIEVGFFDYIVEAENEFLCIATDTITLQFENCNDSPTSVDIEVYPSPTEGPFTLKIYGAGEKIEIFILDIRGREIRKRLIENNQISILEFQFDLSNELSGVYYVWVKQGAIRAAAKEVVKLN
jgi:hypothetical protein